MELSYSVPQYNPERGVVGKCDMCKGRLDDGLEPACVNACPEGAIEIELVHREAWRDDYALAESPGLSGAEQTVSTTRITLPHLQSAGLERVDLGQIQREHAHAPLIYMTALMQAVTGALWVLLAWHALDALRLLVLAGLTSVALTLSTLHLGRPAYAYRALKMWRGSWLSREVLLFTLFIGALVAATFATIALQFGFAMPSGLGLALDISAALLGALGMLASAAIYMVQARPAWNTLHTPLDFSLTAALLGSVLAAALTRSTIRVPLPNMLDRLVSSEILVPNATMLIAVLAVAWLINQAIRVGRLRKAAAFEARAAWSLLSGDALWPVAATCVLLLMFGVIASADQYHFVALVCAFASVLLSRYLFFVTVVPLNMALTFVRSRPAGAHA